MTRFAATLLVTLVLFSACAHPKNASTEPAQSSGVQETRIPPRMLPRAGNMVSFRSTGTRPRGTVEVSVDANGRPDIGRIRYSGTFSQVTRRDLEDFFAQASFAPAMVNGVPAPGVFKMTFR